MSDLVERLRGQKVMDPARGLMCSPTREEEEAADRIEELEGIVREALPILDGYEDCGPSGETWQSDELMVLVAKARAALGE